MTDEEAEQFMFDMNKLLDDYRGGPPRYIGDGWPKPKKEINYEEHPTLSELPQYKRKGMEQQKPLENVVKRRKKSVAQILFEKVAEIIGNKPKATSTEPRKDEAKNRF